jgi:hypothetical protein
MESDGCIEDFFAKTFLVDYGIFFFHSKISVRFTGGTSSMKINHVPAKNNILRVLG